MAKQENNPLAKKIKGYKPPNKIKKSNLNLTIDNNIKERFAIDCFAADVTMTGMIVKFMVSFSAESARMRSEVRKKLIEQQKEVG